MQDDDPTARPATPSAAEVTYHLFMLGLTWIHESNPDGLMRRGASVMAAVSMADPAFSQVRSLAEEAWDLRDLVLEHGQVQNGDKLPRKKELADLIAKSDRHTIIIAKPPIEAASSDPSPQALFGPGGYSFAITNTGIAFAMEFAAQYAPLLTAEKCLAGWKTYCQQVRYLKGTQSRTRTATQDQGVGSEVRTRSIPEAPNVEYDW